MGLTLRAQPATSLHPRIEIELRCLHTFAFPLLFLEHLQLPPLPEDYLGRWSWFSQLGAMKTAVRTCYVEFPQRWVIAWVGLQEI